MPKSKTKEGLSEDTKAIVVVLLLIFIYPIGLLLTWFWVKWSAWVKVLLTIPLIFIAIAVSSVISAANPGRQLDKVECRATCQRISEQDKQQRCFEACDTGKVFIK